MSNHKAMTDLPLSTKVFNFVRDYALLEKADLHLLPETKNLHEPPFLKTKYDFGAFSFIFILNTRPDWTGELVDQYEIEFKPLRVWAWGQMPPLSEMKDEILWLNSKKQLIEDLKARIVSGFTSVILDKKEEKTHEQA